MQRCTEHKERNLLLSGVNRTESANKRFSALECLLLGVKRTSISGVAMSAYSQEETFRPQFISIDSAKRDSYTSIHDRGNST